MQTPAICQLVHTLNFGGAEVLARAFALEARDSFRPVFACLDEAGGMADDLRLQGHCVEVLDRRPGFDVRCVRRLARFLRQQHVALVHAHQYAPFLYSAMTRLLGARVPILFLEHGRDWPDYRRPKRVLANRLLLRPGDRVVAVGQCVRQALIDHEGLPPERIEVVYNGVDLQRYRPQHPEREQVRQELGLSAAHIAIFQVARLDRLKDQRTTLEALARLAPQQPDARLVLVGDGEDRGAIERRIAELELKSFVRLLGSRNDVPRLLQAADIVLLSSVSEGIPLTLIEGMASGLPCAATRVGGVPEVIVDGQTGLLAEPADADDLSRQLGVLCANHELRQRMGEAGRQRAETHFDGRQMHAAYQRIYREMLRSRGRGAGSSGVME